MNPAGVPERLVIVGASLAGLRAAEAARSTGWRGALTLIGQEEHVPYDRPPLSKSMLDSGAADEVSAFRSRDELESQLDTELVLGATATGLDLAGQRVMVGEQSFGYDALILATGSQPVMLLGTEDLAGVHCLRTHEDAVAIRQALDRGARTVVIGAGFIGSEIASAARKRGLSATIVEQMPVPLTRSLGPEPGEICADLHRAAGTQLRLGRGVVGLLGSAGTVTGVELDDGEIIEADLVVVGIGVRPATGWLEDSGLVLHHKDRGIVCDESLSTSAPGVWAAGDVAHAPSSLFDGDLMRPEHWTNAAEQGALAARNAVGAGQRESLESVPYFWSDWYGHRIQFVGTPDADEVVVFGPRGPGALVLYRRRERLVGTLTIDRPRDIMKFRRRILEPDGWAAAVTTAQARVAAGS